MLQYEYIMKQHLRSPKGFNMNKGVNNIDEHPEGVKSKLK